MNPEKGLLSHLELLLLEQRPPELSADEWSSTITLARGHGVLGFVLEQGRRRDWLPPGAVLREAETLLATDRLWQKSIERAAGEVRHSLCSAGLVAIALKGPELARRLYPEPELRRSSDLDFLVRSNQAKVVSGLMEDAGWARYGLQGPAAGRRPHTIKHLHSCGIPIEVHYNGHRYGDALDTDEAISRATSHEHSDGTTSWTLCPEDELLYLMSHAAKHRFQRLCWLVDLRLFLDRYPLLDWQAVKQRARQGGVFQLFVAAAYHWKTVLGSGAPELASLARSAGPRIWLADRISPEELRLRLWRPLPGMVRVGYESLLTDRHLHGLATFCRYSWKLSKRAFGKSRSLWQPARKSAPDSSSSRGADP